MPEEVRGISLEDIGRVIARWKDDEVERLPIMAADEARQRGLLQPNRPWPARPPGRVVRQRRPEVLFEGLAPGHISAIHAVSQAGITLGKIAQKFGPPLAAVKRVITVSLNPAPKKM